MSVAAGIQIGEEFTTMDEINLQAAKVATGLSELGVSQLDTVAILLRNDIPFLVTGTAAKLLGAFPVPINWHLSGAEVAFILNDSSAKVLVVHDDILQGLGTETIPDGIHVVVVKTSPFIGSWYGIEGSNPPLPEGAISWVSWTESHSPWSEPPPFQTESIIYTSGTTGQPKGVRRQRSTPEQAQALMMGLAAPMGVAPGMRTVISAPLYHTVPNVCAGAAMSLGAFMVLMPRFDAEELLRLIDTHKLSHFQMVPTMFVRLLQLPEEVRTKYDVSSLQCVTHSAAPCAPDVKKAMIEWWGPVINESYGATELGFLTLSTSEDFLKYPGTVGRPLPEATIKIYNDDGEELPAGEQGTVYARLNLFRDFTYIGDEEKRQSVEREGLITCGDVGYINEEGYLFLCDRAADMIISGGVNIYPAEIEAALITHEGVQDCAVFGIPDAEMGEKVAAIIEPRPGATLDKETITAFLRDRIAGYKLPRHIEFQENLPREDSGKLFKRKLREPFWADSGRSI
jgi:long-chain acyl-CoA synthetase